MSEILNYVNAFCLTLNNRAKEEKHSGSFEIVEGSKYVRIERVNTLGHGRSIYAFVVKEDNSVNIGPKSHNRFFKAGDILKPASWAAPTKNFKRANVFVKDYHNLSLYGL